MDDRPVLDRNLDRKTFRDYYYAMWSSIVFRREGKGS